MNATPHRAAAAYSVASPGNAPGSTTARARNAGAATRG